MNRVFLGILLLAFFTGSPAVAQISEPGVPPGFDLPLTRSGIPFEEMPAVDTASLVAEDMVLDTIEEIPWRFGENIPVNLHPGNSGKWEEFPDGTRLWRLGIASPGAYSLNLTFDEYKLPEGASLYVYDTGRSHILGAFTHRNNQEDLYFATTLIPSDSIIIEYVEPPGVDFPGRLKLQTVTHAYRDPGGFVKSLGSSGSCNLNVACEEAEGWDDQISASVMLLTGSNGFCSGAMINNTKNDARPFLLTANHCYRTPSTVVVWFNWESQDCENPEESPPYDALSGAVSRARNAGSDFWLLELNHDVPESYDPYFAGWNRTLEEELTDTIVGIHHPRGDIKKFSFANEGVQAASYLEEPGSGDTHWYITWSGGTTTEPASSGSPLFDGRGRIIGQLHGGYAACGNTRPDWYGRFGRSWEGGQTEGTSLRPWLDPIGSDPEAIDGLNPFASQVAMVSSFEAYADSPETARLEWSPNDKGDPVAVAIQTEDRFGRPVGPVSLGDTIRGGGKIIYLGYDTILLKEDLQPGMDYYFSAWSFDNIPSYSPGLEAAVTTPCPDFFSLPFFDDFREGRLSGCWEEVFVDGSSSWIATGETEQLPDSAAIGDYALSFSPGNGDGESTTRLLSPPVQYGSYDSGVLSFYLGGMENEAEELTLTVMFREYGEETWITLADVNVPGNGWVLEQLELPGAVEGFQLAFQASSNGSGSVLLDAISVEGRYDAVFPPPQHFAAGETGADYIRLNWEKPVEPSEKPVEPSAGDYSPVLEGYQLYRDDQLVYTGTDPDELSYTDEGLPVGAYRYYARAVYSNPSRLSDATAEVTAMVEEGPLTYELTLDSEGPGITHPREGNYLFNEGAEVILEAEPGSNARFVRWEKNGAQTSGDLSKRVTINDDLEITAVFAPEQYELVLTSYPENTGEQRGGGVYDHGSVVSLETSIPENYDFLGWHKGNQLVSVRRAFDYTVQSADTLVAHFFLPLYEVSVDADPLTGGKVSGDGEYYRGEEARLEALPGSDYLFSHWELDGEAIHESPEYIFTVEGPVSLTAVFREKPLVLEIRALPQGAGWTSPQSGVSRHEVGEVVELVAYPSEGFSVRHWDIEGKRIYNDVAQVMVRGDMVVTAVFDTPVSAEDPDTDRIRIFPNPVSSNLTVSWPPGVQVENIRLKGMDGRVVYARKIQPGVDGREVRLSVADLAPGVYIIHLTGPDDPVFRKVLVY
ncbi:MAG: InlB B-repeat-containing protein [Bacteroidales bacterium]